MLETENLPIPSLETKPSEYDSYQCTLSSKFKDIAKEELREDESVRTQSLAQFREWIAKHPHIKKCRTGKELKFIINVPKFKEIFTFQMHHSF